MDAGCRPTWQKKVNLTKARALVPLPSAEGDEVGGTDGDEHNPPAPYLRGAVNVTGAVTTGRGKDTCGIRSSESRILVRIFTIHLWVLCELSK